jgi:hypothetical protein
MDHRQYCSERLEESTDGGGLMIESCVESNGGPVGAQQQDGQASARSSSISLESFNHCGMFECGRDFRRWLLAIWIMTGRE